MTAGVLFLGGIADGQFIPVDTTKEIIMIPHPLTPITLDLLARSPTIETSKIKTDRYRCYRRWQRTELGYSISSAYVYEGTDG